MSIRDEPIYSPETDTQYPNWDALVAAEANGWIAVLILEERAPKKSLFTFSVGPFPTHAEAVRARNRMRRKHQKQEWPTSILRATNVKPVWKEMD